MWQAFTRVNRNKFSVGLSQVKMLQEDVLEQLRERVKEVEDSTPDFEFLLGQIDKCPNDPDGGLVRAAFVEQECDKTKRRHQRIRVILTVADQSLLPNSYIRRLVTNHCYKAQSNSRDATVSFEHARNLVQHISQEPMSLFRERLRLARQLRNGDNLKKIPSSAASLIHVDRRKSRKLDKFILQALKDHNVWLLADKNLNRNYGDLYVCELTFNERNPDEIKRLLEVTRSAAQLAHD